MCEVMWLTTEREMIYRVSYDVTLKTALMTGEK